MTTPWTASNATPEQRARAVLESVYLMRWPDEDYAKVAAAIKAAVAAETDRCARVVEDLNPDGCVCLRCIARAIRTPTAAKEET